MRLLLDENLSDRIPSRIDGLFPGSCHVKDYALNQKPDEAVWEFARENGFAILTKDWDFHQRSLFYGFPPKVVFLKIGNCTTDAIVSLISWQAADIADFLCDKTAALLILEK
jgi:predicted nuclease of predicted toxin-antitoxin system